MPWLLSQRAETDLLDIFDYTIKVWGFDQAMLYNEGIESAFAEIVDNPNQGRSLAGISEESFRWTIGRHFIIYKKLPHGILILRILHEKMDYS